MNSELIFWIAGYRSWIIRVSLNITLLFVIYISTLLVADRPAPNNVPVPDSIEFYLIFHDSFWVISQGHKWQVELYKLDLSIKTSTPIFPLISLVVLITRTILFADKVQC